MTDQNTTPEVDENQLIAERRAKLAAMREEGIAFPNAYRREALAQDLNDQYGQFDKPELEENTSAQRLLDVLSCVGSWGKPLCHLAGRQRSYSGLFT